MSKQQLANLLSAITIAISQALLPSLRTMKTIPSQGYRTTHSTVKKNPTKIKQQKSDGLGKSVSKPIRKPSVGNSTCIEEVSKTELDKEPARKVIVEIVKKSSCDITPDQDAIICGTLLGDGHIQKRNTSYRLKIVHTAKQKALVDWKFEKLQSLCNTTKGVTQQEQSKDGKTHTVYGFSTSSNQDLKKYHDLFYKKETKIVNGKEVISYKKTITPELISYLPKNNYTLSTFYLDDGSARTDCYSARFATQGFSKEECHLLQNYFSNTWDLKTSVVLHSRKKSQYSLSVPAKVFPRFIEVVENAVREVPEMEYKLNEKHKENSKFK